MRTMEDLVSTTLNNGVKMPLLGFSPEAKGVSLELLESAYEAGYRHFVIQSRGPTDDVVAGVMREWLHSSSTDREELFISVKISILDPRKVNVRSRVAQDVYTIGCDYVDLLIVDVDSVELTESPKSPVLKKREEEAVDRIAKSLDAVVADGSVRATGLSCSDVAKLDDIVGRCRSSTPQVLQINYMQAVQDGTLSRLHTYCKYRALLPLSLLPDAALVSGDQLPNNHHYLISVKKASIKNRKSREQIMVRGCLETSMAVVMSLRDVSALSLAFQVYDFKLSEPEYAELRETAG